MTDIQVIILVAAIVVIVVVAGILVHRQGLRRRFADEYDRLVSEHHGHIAAYRELRRRERHVAGLDIRPLTDEAGTRYAEQWRAIQGRFLDDPHVAVTEADALLNRVMTERGYQTADVEAMFADLSVHHATSLGGLREAYEIGARDTGEASTEQLRQALVNYRAIFVELLDVPTRLDDMSHPVAAQTEMSESPGTRAASGVTEPGHHTTQEG